MHRTKRISLVLTPMEKTVVEELAEAEGGLTQSALLRRLIRNAARERGIWPPDKQSSLGSRIQGLKHA